MSPLQEATRIERARADINGRLLAALQASRLPCFTEQGAQRLADYLTDALLPSAAINQGKA